MMRRLQAVGSTVLMLLALGMLARHVTAYSVNGPVWGVRQVPYYVNPQNRYVPESDAVAAIASGASAWSGAANIGLVYAGRTSGSSLTLNGKNEVFFRDDTSGFIAEAYWWYDGAGHLLDADIVFHENYRFYSGNSGCNGDGYYIENAGAHEFGHVLGLWHSASDVASMWPFEGACETIRETLDGDDIAGLRSLYPGSFNPAPVPPSAPTQLAVGVSAANPAGSLVLAWFDNANNETGYRVERSPNGSTFSEIAQLGASVVSYVDSGLASGATFYYRVYAYNGAGPSPPSNVASGVTQIGVPAPSTAAPSSPANPSPADGAADTSTTVTLAWTATNATRYDVYVNGSLAASNLTTASMRMNALSSATPYSWLVVAKNAGGSTTGPTWSFTTRPAKGHRK